MPYQPYQSTWNNPYLPAYNQGQPVQQMMQPYEAVMGILNEHMETIKMLYPKTYDSVVQKIREL